MKKSKKIKAILTWLKDAGLKAFAVILLVCVGFYAYAAVTWPAAAPNPTTGVVGLFVGATADLKNGNVGGYDTANALCVAAHPGSHICTSDEMINSYNHAVSGSPILTATGTLWINNGPPGYVKYVINDCKGWTSNVSTIFGSIWKFDVEAAFVTPCNQTIQFACCQ